MKNVVFCMRKYQNVHRQILITRYPRIDEGYDLSKSYY